MVCLWLGESEVPGLAPLVAECDQNGSLIAKYHHYGGGLMAITKDHQSYWYVFETSPSPSHLFCLCLFAPKTSPEPESLVLPHISRSQDISSL